MWKVIENATNYEISDEGFVRNRTTQYILKGRISKSGYLQVSIKHDLDNKFKNEYIHRLVALYFLQKDNEKDIVNHKDGNKLNNNVDNLEWVSHSENTQHAHDINLIKKTSNKKIGMYDKDYNLIKTFDSIVEAFHYLNKPSRVNIDNVLQGKQKTAYGFYWKYLN